MTKRLIARLDIKGPNLVKGIHLEGLRVLGEPREFATHYFNEGADELLYMDIVASLYGRNSLDHIISETCKDVFIPLTVGGGIRTLQDIERVLKFGADKVAINTAAINNPEFIKEASIAFGSSTIVVAIESIKTGPNEYLAFTDCGREHTGQEVVDWAKKVQDQGAGELLITSVDREGTGDGMDHELIKMITDVTSIPIIAHGGIGKKEHVSDVFEQNEEVGAVAIASSLHYEHVLSNNELKRNNQEGNDDFLKNRRPNKKITPCSIGEIKSHLGSRNIQVPPHFKSEVQYAN